MGSAESSSLESVECLSGALTDIERKLADIEDVHLHHDAKICHDDMIVIAGKRIQCRTGLHIVTGPVVGIVTQTSAKMLLEVSAATEVSVNVFLLSSMSSDGRFVSKKVFPLEAYQPRAVIVDELSAGSQYAVYVGGVAPKDALSRYAVFHTLPSTDSASSVPLRVVLSHECRADTAASAEADVRALLESAVMTSSILSTAPVDDIEAKDFSGGILNGVTTLQDSNTPVHITVHLGSFISVEHIIKTQTLHLLDILSREDCSPDAWMIVLEKTESMLRAAYRDALNAASVARVMRRTGNIFIGGQGEVGGAALTMLMSTQPKHVPASSAETGDDAPVAVAEAVALSRQRILRESATRSAAEEELRELMVAAVVRAARRVYWLYMRQLWQESTSFERMVTTDASDEVMHRSVLVLYKSLQTKRKLQLRMGKTVQKLLDNFGADNAVAGKINNDYQAVETDIRHLEEDLQSNLNKWILAGGGSDDGASLPLTAVNVGSAVFLLLDSSWGVLGGDGKLRRMMKSFDDSRPSNTFEIQIPEHVWPLLTSQIEADFLGSSSRNDESGMSREIRVAAPTRLFACCPDAMLLYHDRPQNAPAGIFSLRGHGFTCSLSAADRIRLLTIVARWQESSMNNAALLACGGGTSLSRFAPIDGWISPAEPSPDEQGSRGTSDNEIGWNLERARFRYVVTGKLHSLSVAPFSSTSGTSSKYRLKNSLCDISDAIRLSTLFRADDGEYNLLWNTKGLYPACTGFEITISRTGCSEIIGTNKELLSFTDCLTCPDEMATVGEVGGGACESNRMFVLKHVSDVLPVVTCVVGPIVGKITTTSVSILLEFSWCDSDYPTRPNSRSDSFKDTWQKTVVEITVVDVVTGVRHPYEKLARLRKPEVLVFDTLVPDRGYEIRLTNRVAGGEKTDKERNLGSFKTARIPSRSTRYTLGSIALREKTERNSAAVIDARMEEGRNWLSRFLVLGDCTPSVSADAYGVVIPDVDVSLADSMISASEMSSGNAAYHRVRIEQGLAAAKAVGELTTAVYNSIDTVIHIGGTVDLSVSLEAAISALLAAEASSVGNGSNCMRSTCHTSLEDLPNAMYSTTPNFTDPSKLLHEAEEVIRDAYRLHWGSSYMSGLMSKGSHLFVSSPLLDLLRATHMTNLQQLSRDLSPFCVFHLLRILEKLQDEYQKSMWVSNSVITSQQSPGGSSVHYTSGGRVCLFELLPKIILDQEWWASGGLVSQGERLISDADFETLSALLFGPRSQISDFECPITSLVILSPIPLVLGDQPNRDGVVGWPLDGSSLVSERLAFTHDEIGNLLNLLTRWISEDPWTADTDSKPSFSAKREVFFVCGGSKVNFSSVIRCEDFVCEDNTVKSNEALCIKQLCCAPFVGIAPDLDGVGVGQNCENSLIEGSFVVTSTSGSRRYSVTPIRSSFAVQVGVITTAEKSQHLSDSYDTGKSASASAGCFHLDLTALREDSLGLGHDYLPSDVESVWKRILHYCDRSPDFLNSAGVNDNDVCEVVFTATGKVFNELEISGVLLECHEWFRKGKFGGTVRESDLSVNVAGDDGDISAKSASVVGAAQGALLSEIDYYLLDRMPDVMKRLFPSAPSQLISKLVWNLFSKRCSESKAVQNSFTQIGVIAQRDDLLFASLCNDFSWFSKLCYVSLVALAMSPHCSLALGLNDGW